MPSLAGVITTIQEPTPSVHGLATRLRADGSPLLVIGDRKGPVKFDIAGAEFVPFEAQPALPFLLAPLLPADHYARKNLGYLLAASRGASCIYETDDDNAPAGSWQPRALTVSARPIEAPGWCNAFSLFTDALIWPRGFPLDRVRDAAQGAGELDSFEAPIQQGLADHAPDVDAVWRLILDRPFTFDQRPSVHLAPGTWCPFNSQSTWWWPPAYPLLYLPSYCTFRMTDIWRGFVAQRCLWAMGRGIAFHAAEVIQQRNPHRLMGDFEDELPGYLGNDRLIATLDGMSLCDDSPTTNLRRCYEALVEAGFMPEQELPLVDAWCADLTELTDPHRSKR